MITKEFKKKYLSYYLLLEENFNNTFNYVSVEEDNYSTYSDAYLQLLLAIGSEIEVMRKLVVKSYFPKFDEKKDSLVIYLRESFPDIENLEVKFRYSDKIIKPWDYTKEPDWWTAYNEIKHNRLDVASKFDITKKYYQYANLKNVILALAALFSLEFIAYRKFAIDSGESLFLPTVKTLFSMNNLYWKDIEHGSGYVYIEGCMYAPD